MKNSYHKNRVLNFPFKSDRASTTNGSPQKKFLIFMLMLFSTSSFSQGTWTALTNTAPNNNQGVLFLLSDGTVLCKTGSGGAGASPVGNLYNKLTPTSGGSYINGTWSSIAPMADDRRFYSSQMLQDGRMYVCGGEYGSGGSDGEVYNPLTNSWSAIPAPGGFISDANSEILEDGRVLQAIVGGTQRTCRLYNPATNTFTNAGSTIGSHNECTWHKLPDGTILMIPKNGFTSERYFPNTNTWVADGVCPVQLYSDFGSEIGGAAMLPDGRIWFVGGRENTAFYTPSGTSAAGTWTAGPDIPNLYGQADGPVSVLRDGKVLFTCSPRPFAGAGNVFNTPTRFYEFDPIANTYTLLTAPNGAANLPSNTCYQTNFVNLPNGQILYGLMGTNQYYVYTPAGSASASWKPSITSGSLSSGNFCNHYRIRGIRFNGISCGSIYGDDWQMNTNWPIVKIGTQCARTFNWNSTGVDRGSLPDTVDFTLPAGLANGSYALTVTANGITSNSITFTTYPDMISDVTPPSICSGHAFVYTPIYDRSCVTDTWTRAAVAGISNAAITTPQSANPNEILYNTTSSPIAVTYAYSMTHQGYATTQNVVVVVNPSPNVTTVASDVTLCLGATTTITASGASTYAWDPGISTGSVVNFTPSVTTTYTVTGTNAYGCTDVATRKIYVSSNPTATTSVVDEELCAGSNQSTTISVGANQTINSILTTLAGGNGLSGNVFDVHAYNSITITDFTMNLGLSTDSVEVYYNPGGYGNADVTSNTGWTKLGATVAVTSQGPGALTTIPTTSNLTISAGSTYGILILCNGPNVYTNGTLVGSIAASNLDLYITEGHGGNGFGGTFNFTLSPRVFNGTVEYRTNLTDYLWAPASTLSSTTVSNPTASPTSTTNYTVTVTDGNGCTGTAIAKVYVYPKPVISGTTASPASICRGATSQLNVTHGTSGSSQNLLTTLEGGNNFNGNMFDIHALNNITITNVRMNIGSGDSAEVWYKTSPYGNANVTSSAGWTKLGNTVAITPAGSGLLTTIPTSVNLVIPAGSTYGIAVVCNGTVYYTNGNLVGAVAYDNPDLEITEGHGGSGFGGTFNFLNSPRIFNGQIDYSVTNTITNYAWTPNSGSLSNSTIQNPVADPYFNTNYTVTVTDVHGCKDTAYKMLYVNKPADLTTSVTPISICPGDSAQLSVTANVNERDSLFTTLVSDNGNGGVAFNVIASKALILRSFKANITAGATQAEVWYKSGGYGNANFTGTAGWTKLGATLTIVAAGTGFLTNLPVTSSLSIPSGATYGIMIVTNGTIRYTDDLNPVGTVYTSNPDMSITIGHGGSGIGSFSFSNSPRVFNGEITYDAVNAISGYVWSPNTNMNNGFISNPKAAPLSTTIYSVTATDINGCTSVASAAVNVSPLPTLGTATASPSSLCLGANVSLAYTAPAGLSCFGAIQSGFAGTYAPSNWSLTQSPVTALGSVNTASAPNSISLLSSNGVGGSSTTSYTITIPCNGVISFNWSYTTVDGPQYDYPKYSINGAAGIIFPGYIAQVGAPDAQSGVFNLAVTAGQTFSFQAYSSDNVGGACTITINNFKAPYQTTSGQSVTWFSAASGGSNLGNGNPQLHTPATANTFTYYAQVSSSVTGCTNTSRVATNSVTVNPIPTVGTTTTAATICEGSSTSITGTGAATYTWQPGGLSGTTINVSPITTTTYTVTGTSAQGCTATALRTITVNPTPVITGSANPGIVCPGGAVTLTGTTAGVTWNWQPGNLNGSPVIVNPVAQTTYTVTATSAAGCTKTQTFVILMNPVPTVTTSVLPSATFCAGGNATITANSATATGYTWQPGGGLGANLIVTLANTYTVTATNAQGCTATATRVITVNPLPTVGSTATSTTICSGTSTTITGTGAVSYVYNPGALSGSSVVVSPLATTTYTIIGTNANGCTNSATRLITVLTSPTVGTTVTSASIPCGGSTTITGTGASSYTWQPGALSGISINVSPLTTTTYTVTGTAANGCTKTATRTITVAPCGTAVSIKLYIEGYYLGAGMMTPVMQNEGVAGATGTQVDTITVEIRNTTAPYAIVATTNTILNTNGTASVAFAAGGTYYLAIKHRNGVQTWSATPITLSGAPVTYDFSNALNKAYGNNQVALGGGVFGFYSGDVNADENVDLLDYSLVDVDIVNFAFGYFATDINGDGNVDLLDIPFVDINSFNFVFSNHP